MKHGINSSRQAITQHLDVLEAAGLIRTRRKGRRKLHWFEGGPAEGHRGALADFKRSEGI